MELTPGRTVDKLGTLPGPEFNPQVSTGVAGRDAQGLIQIFTFKNKRLDVLSGVFGDTTTTSF
ncbi:hypothetical protein [Arenimonas donghaensis]|uniref:hypothetical protein n=1 Tax=Arenimonas donghaensis TaxID=375061 RepID=UPI0012688A5B|nr:hypothetical protein [Arenimonas donghaensis]